jgi:hypothetical protein
VHKAAKGLTEGERVITTARSAQARVTSHSTTMLSVRNARADARRQAGHMVQFQNDHDSSSLGFASADDSASERDEDLSKTRFDSSTGQRHQTSYEGVDARYARSTGRCVA